MRVKIHLHFLLALGREKCAMSSATSFMSFLMGGTDEQLACEEDARVPRQKR